MVLNYRMLADSVDTTFGLEYINDMKVEKTMWMWRQVPGGLLERRLFVL